MPLSATPLKIIKFIPYFLIISLIGCRNDKGKLAPKSAIPATSSTVTSNSCASFSAVSYTSQVQPILNAYCVSCHDASAGIRFDNYAGTALYAQSGQLKGSITGNPNNLKMPPFADLDSCQIRTIVNWINEGDLNN